MVCSLLQRALAPSLGPRLATAPAAKRWRAPTMQEANSLLPGLCNRSGDPTLGRRCALPPTWGLPSGVPGTETRTRPNQGYTNAHHTCAIRAQCRRNIAARRHGETFVATAAPNHWAPSQPPIRRQSIPPTGEVWHCIPRPLYAGLDPGNESLV
jgi:hypothetical protein